MHKIINRIKYLNNFVIKSEGNSMWPVLHSRDVLYYTKTKINNIQINDIVLVERENKLLTHRVIYKTSKYIITKGDGNLISDGKFHPKHILGKLFKVKRKGRVFKPEDIYLFQSTQYFRAIIKIKKAIEKEKIKIVFLKGLPLHLYYEDTHPRRIYADCDVLIDKSKLPEVANILKVLGYKSTTNTYTQILKRPNKNVNEIDYWKIINNIPIGIDIHLAVFILPSQFENLNELYPFSYIEELTDNLLNNKKIIKVYKENFPILSTDNLIIYLCLNLLNHNYKGSFRLELLDKIVRKTLRSKSYLSLLTKKINKYQLEGYIYPTFCLLKKYYNTPLSTNFLTSLKPNHNQLLYFKKNILSSNIFDDETSIQTRINCFNNLFYLSPNPLWKKLRIIFNLQVIYSIFWVIIFFLRRSSIRSWKSFFARTSVML